MRLGTDIGGTTPVAAIGTALLPPTPDALEVTA